MFISLFCSYIVATSNYPPPAPGADGGESTWHQFYLTNNLFFAVRPDPGTTWHRILSFNQNANNYLRNLTRGSRVYVEANLEVREPTPDATPGSAQSVRQVFLRHGK